MVDLSFFPLIREWIGGSGEVFILGCEDCGNALTLGCSIYTQSDSIWARCRIWRLTRGQVSAEAESLCLLFRRRLAGLLLASPHALLFPVLGPQLLFVSVSCLLAVVIWIMSALFVIYLFIFSIGTCFRFDCHEDTFAWLMVQLFFMGVLSSAHLFGESWRIFKQHKARHTLIWVVCVCVFVFNT